MAHLLKATYDRFNHILQIKTMVYECLRFCGECLINTHDSLCEMVPNNIIDKEMIFTRDFRF